MYRENTTLEQLDLLEHWNNPVILLIKENTPIIDGVVEIYLTTESVNDRVARMLDQTEIGACQITCIQAVHTAIQNECSGLLIGGLTNEELYITREKLKEIEAPVAGIIKMMEIASEVATKEQAYKDMQELQCYLLGDLTEEMDMTRGEDGAYDRVKVFLVENHAIEENTRNFKVNTYSFGEIISHISGKYSVVIEPYEEYQVVFSKEEIKAYQ